ncbi:unnamed protein product [Enterobius vermicularis]|uniref:Coiled-coil domain-containing protein 6 n=1 Tax=Enterobius vermicularis TaxID=51028 RepID=A0A0N4VGT7_ENTVE|nr:unnamed protein product [Enterobius vermicularis]
MSGDVSSSSLCATASVLSNLNRHENVIEMQRSKRNLSGKSGSDETDSKDVLAAQSKFASFQFSQMMSDSPPSAISDDTLLSLFEGRIPKTTVEYDRLLTKAVELLHQKMQRDEEIVCLRSRNESLAQTNRSMREKNVRLHAKAEQEEEYISNMLLKRIQRLKNDKEALALKYEQEEEFLTNDLTRKLTQLQSERDELAGRIEAEQSSVVDRLLVKIRKLEAEINANHTALEQLRREKVDLENALEHEQESLFNTLGKRMDQLEAEKRRMQARLEQQTTPEEHSPGTSVTEIFPTSHEEGSERRSSRAEVEARKLREECRRQRSVIANLKGIIDKLQRQLSSQESIVAQLLSMREKAAETRADIRRSRARMETNLARCLESYRVFAASETAREADEDKVMDELINRISIPKSTTPTLPPASPAAAPGSQTSETDLPLPTIEKRPPSVRSDSQVDRMEEGSEVADVDIDSQMDGAFSTDDGGHYIDDTLKGETPYSLQFGITNEDSNESSESVNINIEQFARPALPPARSPGGKKEF